MAHARGIACVYDLGSGLMMNLSGWGLSGEPTVPEAVATGADLVAFSGDKLLGGPQAGILVGSEAAIAACRADPIARTVRADKLTLAALEATLALYRDPELAIREIPVLNMLTENEETIRARAERLGGQLDRKSTRLNSSHGYISYAVFCLKKKNRHLPSFPMKDRRPNLW